MAQYFRPLVQTDPQRPPGALGLAGGWSWFNHCEVLERGRAPQIVPAREVPAAQLDHLTRPRAALATCDLSLPRLMGILNITPDSFSDGGDLQAPEAAARLAREMAAKGADFLDVGGESTRPGAQTVAENAEIARVEPVIKAIRQFGLPISIDTRKAAVARAALSAGAAVINDVSALQYDAELAPLAAQTNAPIVLMHAQGAPETMQDDPRYGDVLLDVFDGLAAAVARAKRAGIDITPAAGRIILDPGIGFGKTQTHNLALLRGISLFHGFGYPVLLGASRKRFIGAITGVEDAKARVAGTLTVTQAAIMQGIQIHRVHDIDTARQSIDMLGAITDRWDYSHKNKG